MALLCRKASGSFSMLNGLDLRGAAVAAGQEDGHVIDGERGQQERVGPLEERLLPLQAVNVPWEEPLEEVHDAACHVNDAAVRP
eukprot:scaffold360107_cov49-Prasinocladus_malaysianus.AAC.2